MDFDKISDLPGEKWAIIDGTGEKIYKVSNMGRLMSLNGSKKILTPYWHSRNGFTCNLGNRRTIKVSSIVIKAFKPNPFNDTRWIYLDGDRHNCKADNLEWYGVYWYPKSLSTLYKEMEDNHVEASNVIAFMEGDEEALNLLFEERRKWLMQKAKYFLFCYNNNHKTKVKNIDIESVVQETFLRAFLAIKRGLLRSTVSITMWFYTIERNILKNICADARKLKEVDMYGNYPNSGEEYDVSDRVVYKEWFAQTMTELKMGRENK